MLGEKLTPISKFLAFFYGCICMAVAFMTQFIGSGILEASLKIFGAVGGPLLSVFTMGMLIKRVNQKVMQNTKYTLFLLLWQIHMLSACIIHSVMLVDFCAFLDYAVTFAVHTYCGCSMLCISDMT